jgi:hypothetical protein
MEDSGTVQIRFYPATQNKEKAEPVKLVEKEFYFGQSGKYYEYIIFFDQVEGLSPGSYRYAIFCNNKLIYEDGIMIN